MLAAAAALLLAPAVTAQDDFTDAELVGRYAFAIQSAGGATAGFSFGGSARGVAVSAVGFFMADGDGNITDGVRFLYRPILRNSGFPGAPQVLHEVIEQTLTGTYSVQPDGTGLMQVTVSPNPVWDPDDLAGGDIILGGAPRVRFVLVDGGRRLSLVSESFGVSRGGGGSSTPFWLFLPGTAERQDAALGPDACDSCEVVALLAPLLPGGALPSSHPCFVEEPEGGGAPAAVGRVRRLR